jgi:hypothetical protein
MLAQLEVKEMKFQDLQGLLLIFKDFPVLEFFFQFKVRVHPVFHNLNSVPAMVPILDTSDVYVFWLPQDKTQMTTRNEKH